MHTCEPIEHVGFAAGFASDSERRKIAGATIVSRDEGASARAIGDKK